MAVSMHCTYYSRSANGTIRLDFDGGEQREYSNLDAMKGYALGMDAEDQHDMAVKLLISLWLNQDPNAENSGLIVGKRITFDLSAQPPIFVENS